MWSGSAPPWADPLFDGDDREPRRWRPPRLALRHLRGWRPCGRPVLPAEEGFGRSGLLVAAGPQRGHGEHKAESFPDRLDVQVIDA